MNIGPYTFEEFKEKAAAFHGYPAPGLLIGGYMVEYAKSLLPEGTIFDAVVETGKCLPDAVQLLTLCSIGNSWMKILNLGRYGLALYDKYDGKGVRVWLDVNKLDDWPEIKAWYLKTRPKKEQDTELLFKQIEEAGHTVCSQRPVVMAPYYLQRPPMRSIVSCPSCGEPYPQADGAICRSCGGESPYVAGPDMHDCMPGPAMTAVPVEEAVGKTALHDMTRIEPGASKGPEFTAGQAITAGDVCRLHQMGRSRVYLEEDAADMGEDWVHENEAALAFAQRMAGQNVVCDATPHEGKINFAAETDGLLVIDTTRLEAFNMLSDVMCATRQNYTLVEKGKNFAGARAIPLYLAQDRFSSALAVLGSEPLFNVTPLRQAKFGVLVTGTEVFQGLIEDKFIPIISAKAEALKCPVIATDIVPDDRQAIADSAKAMLDKGVELLVTTAGLSVDPDDVTRHALIDAGLTDYVYGAPLLPGAMTLVGRMGQARVLGVPACALYYKTTSLDLLLPRLLAGLNVSRQDLARMAEGGFCLSCRSCTFPKCPFGK